MKLREMARVIRAAWSNKSLEEFAEEMDRAYSGGTTRSGVAMGPRNAMEISAFFCGVSIITGALASIKYVLYRRTDDTSRERFRAHPLYGVLHDRANATTTANQWKSTMVGHLLLWGNAYSIMRRDKFRGTIIGLEEILHPSCVKVFRDKATGRLTYDIYDEHGVYRETLSREGARFIFHVPARGFNGITGFSVLSLARESLGLTAAMEQFGQTFFAKGVHAGGFLERPETAPKFKDNETRKRFLESIAEGYSGIKNQGRFILLEEGTKFNKNFIPLEDAQFLVSRTFQIDEVARWLNISPPRLKENSRSTFSNIEHLFLMDIQDCFMPWCEIIEAETNAQLIEPDLQGTAFAEFMMDSLLRADTATRNAALAIQRQWGIIDADTWLAKENMNPLPDGKGKVLIIPTNYTTYENMMKGPQAPAAQATGEKKPGENTETPDDGSMAVDAELDLYGVGVRAGTLTPQVDDEDYFRNKANLPAMSKAARADWAKGDNVRHPGTLQPADTNKPPDEEGNP